jgi:hypothetical protein
LDLTTLRVNLKAHLPWQVTDSDIDVLLSYY